MQFSPTNSWSAQGVEALPAAHPNVFFLCFSSPHAASGDQGRGKKGGHPTHVMGGKTGKSPFMCRASSCMCVVVGKKGKKMSNNGDISTEEGRFIFLLEKQQFTEGGESLLC